MDDSKRQNIIDLVNNSDDDDDDDDINSVIETNSKIKNHNTMTIPRNSIQAKRMRDDMDNLMPLLEEYKSKTSNRVYLCSAKKLEHIQQFDGWSCGYRNLQMLLIALANTSIDLETRILAKIPEYKNIQVLQECIENAWKDGYDPTGASHFDFKLIGKSEWVGATEVATLLRSIGIHAEIYDFEKDDPYLKIHHFAANYFATSDNATTTYPLYFQYSGHSQLIIGIEKSQKDSTNPMVIMLNPATKSSQIQDMLQRASSHDGSGLGNMCIFPKRKQYQIVQIRQENTSVRDHKILVANKL